MFGNTKRLEARIKELEDKHVRCEATGELILKANAVKMPVVRAFQVSGVVGFRISLENPITAFKYYKRDVAPKCDYVLTSDYGNIVIGYMKYQPDLEVNADGKPAVDGTATVVLKQRKGKVGRPRKSK